MTTSIERRRLSSIRRRAGAMTLGFLILSATWYGPASAEDAPGEPRPIPWLEELFLPVKEKVKPLTPFIGRAGKVVGTLMITERPFPSRSQKGLNFRLL